ncbi:MAG: N-formylglutamate amidohydrolase [Bdellovibrionales bacterium]|nr:N-formylglutamate amidohydrolase [Bdellovibrionales bacterium]
MKPFFVTIPHSGEQVPGEVTWLQGLPEVTLMRDVDRFVDRLYEPVLKELQIDCIVTQWHRYVVDLNRLEDDVDCDSVLDSSNPSGSFATGLHWRWTTQQEILIKEPMTRKLHDQLVKQYFQPFHRSVRQLYEKFKAQGFKKIYHLDAHSMPSLGTSAHKDPGQQRAEVVVSDMEGKSCEPEFRDLVVEAYKKAGFEVRLNFPYVGGRVTQTYGKPDLGQHAIQVELNRRLYMNEDTKELKLENLKGIQQSLSEAISYIYRQINEI